MFVLQNTRGQKHEKYRVRVDPNIHSHVKLLVENGITKKKRWERNNNKWKGRAPIYLRIIFKQFLPTHRLFIYMNYYQYTFV